MRSKPKKAPKARADRTGSESSARGASSDPGIERILPHFGGDSAVTRARMFGSDALKAGGKVFAMTVKGRLVVKLPASRVEELVMNREGTRFDPGHGRVMREWLSVGPEHQAIWERLANEAREFARG